MKATLTFPNFEMAKQFASNWACFSLCGHDMSAVKKDGTVNVTIYDIDDAKKTWIDSYVSKLNNA